MRMKKMTSETSSDSEVDDTGDQYMDDTTPDQSQISTIVDGSAMSSTSQHTTRKNVPRSRQSSGNSEFQIPLIDEDVASRFENLEPEDVPAALLRVEERVKRSASSIKNECDAFYAIIKHFEDIAIETKAHAFRLLMMIIDDLIAPLRTAVSNVVHGGANDATLPALRECLVMCIWFVCRMAQSLQESHESTTAEDNRLVSPVSTQKKRGKGARAKTHQSTQFGDFNWPLERHRLLRLLVRVLRLETSDRQSATLTNTAETPQAERAPLQYLWQPPKVDINVAVTMANAVTAILGDADIVRLDQVDALQDAFTIFALLSNNYGHTYVVVTRLATLLKDKEHLGWRTSEPSASPLAEALCDADARLGCPDVILDLLKHISLLEAEDFNKEGSAKAHGNFVVVITDKQPRYVHKNVDLLDELLSTDNFVVRNAAMLAIGKLCSTLLKSEELSDRDRETRDALLDRLVAHIFDINAHCRARCIAVWKLLVEESAVPLHVYNGDLIKNIIGRLEDKSSNVRKNVVEFLIECLKRNPWSANFNEDDWKRQWEEAEKALDELKQSDPVAEIRTRRTQRVLNTWRDKTGADYENIRKLPSIIDSEDIGDISRTDAFVEFTQSALYKEFATVLRAYVKRRQRESIREGQRDNKENDDDVKEEPISDNENAEDTELLMAQEDIPTDVTELKALLIEHVDSGRLREAALLAIDVEMRAHTLDEFESPEQQMCAIAMLAGELCQQYCELMMERTVAKEQEAIETVEAHCEEMAESDAIERYRDEYNRLSKTVAYTKGAYNYALQLKNVLPTITKLFQSKQATDVHEAIDFVIECSQFEVPGAADGVRSMCNLIWRKDKTVMKLVVSAFKKIYFDSKDENEDDRARGERIAVSLMNLVRQANPSQLASLEAMIKELCNERHLDPTKPENSSILRTLWSYFARQQTDSTSREMSCAAIQILAFCGRATSAYIRSNLGMLWQFGLGTERAMRDLTFTRHVLRAYCTLEQRTDLSDEKNLGNKPQRMKNTDKVFARIIEILVDNFETEANDFTPFMERALDVIYGLADIPDELAHMIIKRCLDKVVAFFEAETRAMTMPHEGAQRDDEDNIDALSDAFNGMGSSAGAVRIQRTKSGEVNSPPVQTLVHADAMVRRDRLLERFLALVGTVGLDTLLYVEESYKNEKKRRVMYCEKAERDENMVGHLSPSKRRSAASRRRASLRQKQDDDDDMALGGATTEDLEQEYVDAMTQRELIAEGSLLGTCTRLIDYVIQHDGRFGSNVCAAAALAMSKCMLISQSWARERIARFFSLMCRSPHANVRANMMIAAGDLCFRWPNLVEPYSRELYECLNDHMKCTTKGRPHEVDLCVRQNCLLVLTHLLLNDMIKPKEYVSEISQAILDPHEEIRALAERFFFEMAQKGDQLYNLMPDVTSRLSEDATNNVLMPFGTHFGAEEFSRVMRFLFAFVTKERHCDSLMDKMCHRMGAVETLIDAQATVEENERMQIERLRQYSYLTTISDKGINRFAERFDEDNTQNIRRVVRDEQVHQNLQAFLTMARNKTRSQDAKERIEQTQKVLTDLYTNESHVARTVAQGRREIAEHRAEREQRREERANRSQRRARTPKITVGTVEEEEDDGLNASSLRARHTSSSRGRGSSQKKVTKSASKSPSQPPVERPRRGAKARRLQIIEDEEDGREMEE